MEQLKRILKEGKLQVVSKKEYQGYKLGKRYAHTEEIIFINSILSYCKLKTILKDTLENIKAMLEERKNKLSGVQNQIRVPL